MWDLNLFFCDFLQWPLIYGSALYGSYYKFWFTAYCQRWFNVSIRNFLQKPDKFFTSNVFQAQLVSSNTQTYFKLLTIRDCFEKLSNIKKLKCLDVNRVLNAEVWKVFDLSGMKVEHVHNTRAQLLVPRIFHVANYWITLCSPLSGTKTSKKIFIHIAPASTDIRRNQSEWEWKILYS